MKIRYLSSSAPQLLAQATSTCVFSGRQVEDAIDRTAQHFGNQQQLDQPGDDAADAVGERRHPDIAPRELSAELRVADQRAAGPQWDLNQIERKPPRPADRRPASLEIDGAGDGLARHDGDGQRVRERSRDNRGADRQQQSRAGRRRKGMSQGVRREHRRRIASRNHGSTKNTVVYCRNCSGGRNDATSRGVH